MDSSFLADIDPFSLGFVNASVDQSISSKLKETSVEVIFYPRDNEVALVFRHGLGRYQQFWNEAGRKLFIDGLERYKEDFANQALVTRFSKSQAAYGKAKGRFIWEPLLISPKYRSSPFISLGYRFKDKSPYFSAYQLRAKEETRSNKGITESPQYSVYFTRAQGDQLAFLFDQAFLLKTLADMGFSPGAPSSTRDAYVEK